MKLNMHILADELADLEPEVKTRDSTALELEGVCLPTGGPLEKGFVYIASAESLHLLDSGGSLASVIYVGSRADLDRALNPWNGLVIRSEAISERDLFARVLDVFRRFDAWERRVLTAIARRAPLQEVLDVGAEVLSNPIALLDRTQALVAWSGPTPNIENTETIWHDVLNFGFARREELTRAEQRDVDRLAEEAAGNPWLFKASRYEDETQCITFIRHSGRTVGVLACTDIISPFTYGQMSLIRALRDLMLILLGSDPAFWQLEGDASVFVNRVLAGEITDRSAVHAHLSNFGWKLGDYYVIAAMRDLGGESISQDVWAHLANSVLSELKPAHVASWPDGVTVLFRDIEPVDRHGLAGSILPLVSRLGLGCGVSLQFRDPADARILQEQARLAAGVATAEERVCLFEEHFQQEIVALLPQGLKLRSLCNPAILEVAESGEKGVELVRTLSTFLTFGKNASESAQELQIHRNTLAHRIDRVAELTGIDVERLSPDEVLVTLVSCAIALSESEA